MCVSGIKSFENGLDKPVFAGESADIPVKRNATGINIIAKEPLMVKIIIGLVMVVGGLSGKLVLVGTNSGVALAVLGGVMIVWGIARVAASRKA
jgi:hypothetical protein